MTTRRTERLILRQWGPADREPFAELNADPEVMAQFPAPLTRAESDEFADRIHAHIERHGWGLWAVEVVGGPRFVGFVGLNPAGFDLGLRPMVEVAWRLARAYWGRGYATEAGREALRVGFDELGLDEIVSFTTGGNARSRAVMERLGMGYVRDFDHPRLPEGHALRRHVLYRIGVEQWRAGG